MEAVPITYAQKFIYGMQKTLGAGSRWLQLGLCVRVIGPIDVGRFERAIAQLAARHPILCSRLAVRGRQVVQWHENRAPSVELLDVAGATDQEVDGLLSGRLSDPLDLFSEGPFGVILARRRADEAFLLLVMHHMFADARALRILLEDCVRLLLNNAAEAQEAPGSNGESGYLAFARHELNMLRDGTYARRVQYWRQYLAKSDPLLRLPDRGQEPAVHSSQSIPLQLSPCAFESMSARARSLGLTPFGLISASIFHALHRATGQSDLLLSVVTDSRRPPFEQTVGQFSELFILRHRRDDGDWLSDEALYAVEADILGGLVNYVPSPYLARRVEAFRAQVVKGFALTEVSVNYLPELAEPTSYGPSGDYAISWFPLTRRTPATDIPYHGLVLSWELVQGDGSLSGFVHYEPALVCPQLAQTITDSFIEAVSGAAWARSDH